MNKEQGKETVIDYELVNKNEQKLYCFYIVWTIQDFSGMLETESAKTNNCKDLVYKLELITWLRVIG